MINIFDYIENKSYEIAEKIGKGDSEDDIELYKYTIFMFSSETFSFLGGLLFAFLLDCIVPYLIVNLVFALMRKGSGGYHCPTFKSCFWTSNILFILASYISIILCRFYTESFLISIILGIYIMPICPKPSKNSPSRGYYEDIRFRKIYRNWFIFFIITNLISILNGYYLVSSSISFSIMAVVFIVSDLGEFIINKILSLL